MRDDPPPTDGAATRRVAYALVAAVVLLSSVAPFARFGPGPPSVSGDDLRSAGVFVLAWLPFVALLVAFARGRWAERPIAGPLGHVALLLTVPWAHAALAVALGDLAAGAPLVRPTGDVRVYVLTVLGTLQYLVLVAAVAAARAGRAAERSLRRATDLELARARLASELARARVDALRAQLQPHFLFNTLNSIGVLATADAPRARTMVRRLSELLRAVLADDERTTVPLQRELELLAAYVEIQEVRFGDRVRVRVDADPGALGVPVPPLLLQPLVENAIQHGVGDRAEGGCVAVRARLAQGAEWLELAVADDGPGPDAGAADGGGVGLRNTRGRLHALYGAAHAFDVGRAAGGGYEVRVALPAAGPRPLGA